MPFGNLIFFDLYALTYRNSLLSTFFKTKITSSHESVTTKCADERLNDIVGSAYYVAPEVLHRSYGTEADMWSIGVIAYILLCGSRPFWARTESGIFRAVLKAEPSFEEAPWPSLSAEAKDFVKRLLNKDYRKRMTASQALSMFLVILLLFNSCVVKICFSLKRKFHFSKFRSSLDSEFSRSEDSFGHHSL